MLFVGTVSTVTGNALAFWALAADVVVGTDWRLRLPPLPILCWVRHGCACGSSRLALVGRVTRTVDGGTVQDGVPLPTGELPMLPRGRLPTGVLPLPTGAWPLPTGAWPLPTGAWPLPTGVLAEEGGGAPTLGLPAPAQVIATGMWLATALASGPATLGRWPDCDRCGGGLRDVYLCGCCWYCGRCCTAMISVEERP